MEQEHHEKFDADRKLDDSPENEVTEETPKLEEQPEPDYARINERVKQGVNERLWDRLSDLDTNRFPKDSDGRAD